MVKKLCLLALVAICGRVLAALPDELEWNGDGMVVLSDVPDNGMYLEPFDVLSMAPWLSGSLRGLSTKRAGNEGNEGACPPLPAPETSSLQVFALRSH